MISLPLEIRQAAGELEKMMDGVIHLRWKARDVFEKRYQGGIKAPSIPSSPSD